MVRDDDGVPTKVVVIGGYDVTAGAAPARADFDAYDLKAKTWQKGRLALGISLLGD